MCHDIHYINWLTTFQSDKNHRLLLLGSNYSHVDHIVIKYTYFILYDKFDQTLLHDCNKSIWSLMHWKSSLYNCYNVHSLQIMLGNVCSKPSLHRGWTVRETLWLGCRSKACEALGLIGLPNWPMGRGLQKSLSLTKLPWNPKWLYEADLTLREQHDSEHASSVKGLSHLIGSKLIDS